MEESRPLFPLREALEHELGHLTESLVHRTFSDHSPCPPPIPAGLPLPQLARNYAAFLSQLLAHAIRQLIMHERRLLPTRSENPPMVVMNRILIQVHALEDDSTDKTRDQLDQLYDELDDEYLLVEQGKCKCEEYRRAWDWLDELEMYTFIARHGGLAFGVKHDGLEEWFWKVFERVTGMPRFSGLVSPEDWDDEDDGDDEIVDD